MKKILIIICLAVSFCGCMANEKRESKETTTIESVLAKGDYIVVDVRTKSEYAEGHVIDAVNIPYDEINENISLDKSKVILVYCKSGARSRIAYDKLASLGFEVFDLGAYDSVELDKE